MCQLPVVCLQKIMAKLTILYYDDNKEFQLKHIDNMLRKSVDATKQKIKALWQFPSIKFFLVEFKRQRSKNKLHAKRCILSKKRIFC